MEVAIHLFIDPVDLQLLATNTPKHRTKAAMRLINTTTFEFREFLNDAQIPKYAILSHRWEDGEASFKMWQKCLREHAPRHGEESYTAFWQSLKELGPGYTKVVQFCRLSEAQNLSWAWVDTCCIDKRSSAELSEAINSMFAWYKAATMCIAYLSDVPNIWRTQPCGRLHHEKPAIIARLDEYLPRSAWFRRGWTLQELLAPLTIMFYSAGWHFLGDKRELGRQLSNITGIDGEVLRYRQTIPEQSVAQRMSWASRRVTTRGEDAAYCLLGLFDVNMPLLYGEGKTKAFVRLQLQIIRKSDDESIFAWSLSRPEIEALGIGDWEGLLAPSPTAFVSSGLVTTIAEVTTAEMIPATRLPYVMTHQGLEFHAFASQIEPVPDKFGEWVVVLNCHVDNSRCKLVLYSIDCDDSRPGRERQYVARSHIDRDAVTNEHLRPVGELCFVIYQSGL